MIGTRSRTDLELSKLDRLDNAALAALAQPKPNTNSKYNFYVKLGNKILNSIVFSSNLGIWEQKLTFLDLLIFVTVLFTQFDELGQNPYFFFKITFYIFSFVKIRQK